ncbi:MAG: carbohydrate ABC transporter permease [Chloroflexota bacterium]
MDIKEHITGYLFIMPAVLVIAVFGFFPIGYAFYMSLHSWRVKKGAFLGFANYDKVVGDWIGLLLFVVGFLLFVSAYLAWQSASKEQDNRKMLLKFGAALLLIAGGYVFSSGWGRMLAAGDEEFLNSLPITLFYALSTVPAELGIAMVLAYILFQNIRGKELFRMMYFLPYITPVVAAAVVFRSMFSSRDTALANIVLGWFNIDKQKWLFESRPVNELIFGVKGLEGFWAGPSLALVTIALFGIWTYVGYNTVIFLAGLGSISKEYYEAAQIDGAGPWDSFRHITLPLLSPVTFYLALIAFIGTFKAFNHIWVMRTPSAQGTVDVTTVNIFSTFYEFNQYGYATAQAILLFGIILGLTLIQNKVFGEKVFYG